MRPRGDTCDSLIIFEIVYASFALIYVLFILAVFLQEIVLRRHVKQVKNITKFLKYGAATVFTFYAMALSFSLGLELPLCIAERAVPNGFNIIMGMFYGCGLLMLVLLFIHRFRLVIEDSALLTASLLRNIKLYNDFLIVSCISSFSVAVILYLSEADRSLWSVFVGICGFCYLLISFSMLSLFVYVLFQLARLLQKMVLEKAQRAERQQAALDAFYKHHHSNDNNINATANNTDGHGLGKQLSLGDSVASVDMMAQTSQTVESDPILPDDNLNTGYIQPNIQNMGVIDENGAQNLNKTTNMNNQIPKSKSDIKIGAGGLIHTTTTIYDGDDQDDAPKLSKTERRLAKLIANMTSYTILVSISLLSSMVFGASFLLFDLDSDIALCSDIFINSLCLYLQFPFANNFYYILCHCCHISMEKLFWNFIQRTTLQSNVRMSQFQRPSVLSAHRHFHQNKKHHRHKRRRRKHKRKKHSMTTTHPTQTVTTTVTLATADTSGKTNTTKAPNTRHQNRAGTVTKEFQNETKKRYLYSIDSANFD